MKINFILVVAVLFSSILLAQKNKVTFDIAMSYATKEQNTEMFLSKKYPQYMLVKTEFTDKRDYLIANNKGYQIFVEKDSEKIEYNKSSFVPEKETNDTISITDTKEDVTIFNLKCRKYTFTIKKSTYVVYIDINNKYDNTSMMTSRIDFDKKSILKKGLVTKIDIIRNGNVKHITEIKSITPCERTIEIEDVQLNVLASKHINSPTATEEVEIETNSIKK